MGIPVKVAYRYTTPAIELAAGLEEAAEHTEQNTAVMGTVAAAAARNWTEQPIRRFRHSPVLPVGMVQLS